MSKRSILALGLFCAAIVGAGQASAASYTATYNMPGSDGYQVVGVVAHGPNQTNVDVITVNLTGPGYVQGGAAGAVALNMAIGSIQISGFSTFSWLWQSDNLLTNVSGVFNTSQQNSISLPFTATAIPGDVYSSYHLYITTTTSGLGGGGYVYSIGMAPCRDCAPPPPPPTVPAPPAAMLFLSGLSGLGLLGWKRRKRAAA